MLIPSNLISPEKYDQVAMRLSEYYKLGLEQPSLDFVDVQIDTDTPLFIDPTALSLLDTEWGAQSRSIIQNYFSLVLTSIRNSDHTRARMLLAVLNEPNETRLGYSADKPRGHGMGRKLARKMWQALSGSRAVASGIIQDLEDTALMIDGVASDVISDIVTNIMRGQLLEYTNAMCAEYGIPTQRIASRPIWNSDTERWENRHVDQPVAEGKPLLLVPKALVRRSITYQADNYYNLYLLERLQEEEARKGFVHLLKKGGSRPLSKKELRGKFGNAGKEQNRRYTPGREDVLQKYRDDKQESPRPPLSHEKIAEVTQTALPDWDTLLQELEAIPVGNEHARQYEDIVRRLFTALFYPWLLYPQSQERLHNGRKIIDITYMNMAQDDFFAWLRNNYPPAPYVIVECKNYREDPDNPALDQLSGRFSSRRGKFGILVARKIENKELFEQKCRDTADDDRGFIIGLDDDDLKELIHSVRASKKNEQLNLLRDKFKRLVM